MRVKLLVALLLLAGLAYAVGELASVALSRRAPAPPAVLRAGTRSDVDPGVRVVPEVDVEPAASPAITF